MRAPRHPDPARRRNRFQPCCNVHPVAKDVVAVDDDVAEMTPMRNTIRRSSEKSATVAAIAVWTPRRIGLGIDDARELKQQPVARRFDDATAVLRRSGDR